MLVEDVLELVRCHHEVRIRNSKSSNDSTHPLCGSQNSSILELLLQQCGILPDTLMHIRHSDSRAVVKHEQSAGNNGLDRDLCRRIYIS